MPQPYRPLRITRWQAWKLASRWPAPAVSAHIGDVPLTCAWRRLVSFDALGQRLNAHKPRWPRELARSSIVSANPIGNVTSSTSIHVACAGAPPSPVHGGGCDHAVASLAYTERTDEARWSVGAFASLAKPP
jgi:hypothetical protein